MFLPKNVLSVINELNRNGYDAFVVGGAVRDYIMGVEPHDYDITTSALPDEIKEIFPNHFALGEKFGTVSVVFEDTEPIEVTTFRKESDYEDGRHPNTVEFVTSVFDDLCRRDFTMNAIAFSPKTGFVDPFNGIDDIKNKVIRCVNNPISRFNEDGLGIIRAVRFAAKLGFEIESETLNGMKETINMIDCVAEERIGPEFIKILISDFVEDVMIKYSFVICKFIPEYKKVLKCKQNNPHHIYNLEGHILKVIANSPKTERSRLAAFFHDIGKPAVKIIDKKGIYHFPNHAEAGEELTKEIMSRLRFSSNEIKEVCLLVKYHDAFWEPNKRLAKNLLSKLGEDLFMDILALRKADIAAQAPREDNSISLMMNFFNEIKEENAAITLKDLNINGNDLISEFNLMPSPILGKILNELLDLVLDEKIENTKEVLLVCAKEILNRNSN